jgi:hypothetical protein
MTKETLFNITYGELEWYTFIFGLIFFIAGYFFQQIYKGSLKSNRKWWEIFLFGTKAQYYSSIGIKYLGLIISGFIFFFTIISFVQYRTIMFNHDYSVISGVVTNYSVVEDNDYGTNENGVYMIGHNKYKYSFNIGTNYFWNRSTKHDNEKKSLYPAFKKIKNNDFLDVYVHHGDIIKIDRIQKK